MAQRAILVGINLKSNNKFVKSMEELSRLVEACELEVVGEITQNLDRVNLAHYIGTGKIPEVRTLMEIKDADIAIFNDELSPSQIRNLEEELQYEIMDRTALILEIFARRAKTQEAKLQVEIAHLEYMLPRLVGLKQSLEQQTGGVGTTNRGSGEKKLELNRRQIQDRIVRLRGELEELVSCRQTQRRQRAKTGIPVVSLVGYTNAGKSTIMNTLLELSDQPENKRVFEKDMLFATLETSVRSIELPDKKAFLLTDTVGFIDKLPHQLVKAFRSTLEEVKESDLLIHVFDSSDPDCENQIAVTNETLAKIGVEGIPVIYAMNKSDLIDIRPATSLPDSISISAKYKTGIDELISLIRKNIFEDYVECEMLIPYNDSKAVSYLIENAKIMMTDYEANGTRLKLECRQSDYNIYKQFVL
jgi:GTP-binding protein HflX